MSEEKLLGHIAVDSGQLMICDPCYIESQWENEDKNAKGFSYEACAKGTLSEKGYSVLNFKAGHSGAGIAFGTAFGDGLYPVFATYDKDGIIESVTVKF